MEKLLIVESPGKIKKISEYLGDGYIVMASVGHIIDLDEKTMSIDLKTFEPEYKIYNDKKEVVSKLIRQANKVGKDNILLAADEDREGEMIAWSLAKELKLKNPQRIVFNSITAKELKNAVANPKTIDYNMVKAQQARRILDRFAGYLLSPLLFKSGFKGAQSAGRVQSVVVKIIVDKEKEIISFFNEKKDTYFYINCNIKIGDYEVLTKLTKKNYNLDADSKEGNKEELDSENAEEDKKEGNNKKDNKSSKSCIKFEKSEEDIFLKILKAMIKGVYKLLNLTNKIRKSNPPPPFTTSTLQQYASQRLGMDAKRTMSTAQKLYEAGHITYMRTDSTAISKEALDEIKKVIEDKYGKEHHQKHEYINKKANTQEAHECVRPTKPQYDTEDIGLVYNDEKRLYNAIWKRTIQSQMKAAEYQMLLIEIEIEDKKELLKEYKLVGTLENLTYEGYLLADGKKKVSEKESNKLLDKKSFKKLEWLEINGIEDAQKPPVRYNDASLINKMDPKNLNIGRPSTYASFIEKIIKRKYVEIKDIDGKEIKVNKYSITKENCKEINVENKKLTIGKESKKLVPTELGTNITNFLELYFKKIMDYQFTANMENDLDEVAEGTKDKFVIINEFYKDILKCIELVKPVNVVYEIKPIISIGIHNDKEITLNNGKFGKYLVYDDKKFNLKQLALEFEMEEEKLENNKVVLYEKIVKKINNVNNIDNINNKNINNLTKEWKIGKLKYLLKKGQYGYYLEEWSITTSKKKGNYSLKYLIDKTAKENNINEVKDDNINEVIELISIENIQSNIDYFKNSKNSKNLKK